MALKLDPSNFNEGQRKAIDGLRKFQESAESTADRLNKESGRKFKSFFDFIQSPIEGIKEGMMRVATESRRSGEAVEKAGIAGGEGMMTIARGALLAYAAIKSATAAVNELKETAKSTEQLGFAAKWAGTPTPWMSRFAGAVYKETGLPQEQSQGYLVNLRQQVEAFRGAGYASAGQATSTIDEMQRQGIQFLPGWHGMRDEDVVPQIIEQISNKMAEKRQEAVQRALSQGSAREAAESQGDATAAGFAARFGMPMQMSNVLSGGWGDLQRRMAEVAAATEEDAKAAHAVEVSERALKLSLDALARAVIDHLAPAIIALNSLLKPIVDWFTGHADAAVGVAAGAAYPVTIPYTAGTAVGKWINRQLGLVPAAPPSVAVPMTKGADGPALAPDASPGSKVGHAMSFFMNNEWTREQAAGITARLYGESGLDTIAHNDIAGGHTGIGQWDSTRWARYSSMFRDAPGGLNSLDNQLAYVQWELKNPEAAAGRSIASQSTAYGAGMAMENYERAGDPAFTQKMATLASSLASIQPVPTTAGGDVTYDHSNTWSGDISVNVPPGSDGRRIGNELVDTLQMRKQRTTDFNVGQE